MQRYFADIDDNKVVLSPDDEHHVLHVMRNRVGDLIEVVSNSTLFLAEIASLKPLEILVKQQINTNKGICKDITLFFALAKGEKIDFVIQKSTELGAKNVVLVNTKRCVVKFDKTDFDKKLIRYSKIAKEASEQSHRLDLLNIDGVYNLKEIPDKYLKGNKFIAYEKEVGSTSSFYDDISSLDKDEPVSIIVGPEGGFDADEVAYLNSLDFKNVSLGNRILRTETAAVYALSVLGFVLER